MPPVAATPSQRATMMVETKPPSSVEAPEIALSKEFWTMRLAISATSAKSAPPSPRARAAARPPGVRDRRRLSPRPCGRSSTNADFRAPGAHSRAEGFHRKAGGRAHRPARRGRRGGINMPAAPCSRTSGTPPVARADDGAASFARLGDDEAEGFGVRSEHEDVGLRIERRRVGDEAQKHDALAKPRSDRPCPRTAHGQGRRRQCRDGRTDACRRASRRPRSGRPTPLRS